MLVVRYSKFVEGGWCITESLLVCLGNASYAQYAGNKFVVLGNRNFGSCKNMRQMSGIH